MSSSELHRQEVIQLVLAKRLSVTKAADRLGLSRPHTSTLVNAYRRYGIEALISKKRARRPNNSYSDAFRDKANKHPFWIAMNFSIYAVRLPVYENRNAFIFDIAIVHPFCDVRNVGDSGPYQCAYSGCGWRCR